ncbi:MAG: D-alanine--D-alanine ligase [Candidatus Caenarcaniphilales bacterium]|nr:D-alanine--D-alanine ligase [Candidatus Caenarcaniphilales bacterium]
MKTKSSMLVNKTSKIIVIDEGFSAEKEVSLRSGRNVANLLSNSGYDNTKSLHLSSKEDLKKIIDLKLNNEIDIAVLMTHGTFGEDGALQGLLELLEIPYTGSKLKASANCMDKITTKAILEASQIPVFKNLELEELLKDNSTDQFPIILKARADGSSVGIKKVNSLDDLESLLAKDAHKSEDLKNKKAFIEPFISGIEITTSIIPFNEKLYEELNIDTKELKNNQDILIDEDLVSLALLKLIPENEFYDYEAKYTAGKTTFELPAKISPELTKKIHKLAMKAYRALECSGFARVDFIIKNPEETPEINILEINTLPGMTDTSDLPAQAKASGLSQENLIELLINSK